MTQCRCDELIAGSSNTVKLVGLTDDTGDHRADATVTVTIKEYQSGDTVSGANAVAMPYDSGDLEYRGIVPHTAALERGERYRIIVLAVVDGVVQRHFPNAHGLVKYAD